MRGEHETSRIGASDGSARDAAPVVHHVDAAQSDP